MPSHIAIGQRIADVVAEERTSLTDVLDVRRFPSKAHFAPG